MRKILRFIIHKRYYLILAAAAIITQCYLQLLLPEYMGDIQTIITQNINNQNLTKDILINGGWMMLISFGVVALAFVQFYSASYISAYTGKMLRKEMFEKVNKISTTDYNIFGTATLITRTTNDVEQIKNFVLMAVRILVMSPTMMIIAIIRTMSQNSKLLVVLCVALPLILIFMGLLLVVASPYFRKIQEKIDNITVVLRENLTGIRVIRAYDQENTETEKFSYANKDLTKTFIKVNRIMTFANPFINVLFNLCFIAIYAIGYILLNKQGANVSILEETGKIAVVGQYIVQIMNSFVMFALIFIMMPQAIACSKRILEVLNIDTNKDNEENLKYLDDYNKYQKDLSELYKKEDIKTKPLIEKFQNEYNQQFNYSLLKYKVLTSSDDELKNSDLAKLIKKYEKIHTKYHLQRKKIRQLYWKKASELDSTSLESKLQSKFEKTGLKGVIEFNDVSFSYPGSDTPCVEHISFKTTPGKTTAIIGSTGSGKSTIINLIPKFYKVTKGQIKLDGVDINEIPSDVVRNKLGFVPQTALLFKGTIRSNMLFGNPKATDDEINKALSVAQAEHFVNKLPKRLDSFVSQSGKNFSGGQKQRLCIARALVKKPEIYIFDDSFSALDFKTDAKLRHALKSYTQGSSIIVVAQRVSSILDADNIIVLNEGKIVGQGTHSELIANCSIYQDIVKSQLDQDEIEKTIIKSKEFALEGDN